MLRGRDRAVEGPTAGGEKLGFTLRAVGNERMIFIMQVTRSDLNLQFVAHCLGPMCLCSRCSGVRRAVGAKDPGTLARPHRAQARGLVRIRSVPFALGTE